MALEKHGYRARAGPLCCNASCGRQPKLEHYLFRQWTATALGKELHNAEKERLRALTEGKRIKVR